MSDKTSLGDRMKKYEGISQNSLMQRTPVIIRLDGKAFHTFTKRINSTNDTSLASAPFSEKLHWVMDQTNKVLCDNIQNVRIGYTQSDEISILITDWNKLTTDQWFGGNVQKTVSVAASIATAYFNRYFKLVFPDISTLAFFDARVFNLPKEEVTNYFIWRQQDASRNSVQMLGHFHFSQTKLHCKNNSQIQDMLVLEKGVNWNDIDTWKKRGSCYHPHPLESDLDCWLDNEIPIFTQDRDYIEKYLQ